MWRLDLGPERDHVQPGDLVADHGGLEASVHPGHHRLLPEQALVCRLESHECRRTEVGPPTAVVVLRLELAPAEPGRRVEGADELGEGSVVGGTGKAVKREPAAVRARLAERGARLDETLEVLAHRQGAG